MNNDIAVTVDLNRLGKLVEYNDQVLGEYHAIRDALVEVGLAAKFSKPDHIRDVVLGLVQGHVQSEPYTYNNFYHADFVRATALFYMLLGRFQGMNFMKPEQDEVFIDVNVFNESLRGNGIVGLTLVDRKYANSIDTKPTFLDHSGLEITF